MKCKRSFEIDEYLKNELDRNAKQDLEEHLKTCKDCLSEVDSLKSISAKLARLKVPDPGDLYFRNNLIKISGSVRSGEKIRDFFYKTGFFKTLAYASAVLIIIMGITILNRPKPDLKDLALEIEDINPYVEIEALELDPSYLSLLEEKYTEELLKEDMQKQVLGEILEDYVVYDEEINKAEKILEGLSEDDFKKFLNMFKT